MASSLSSTAFNDSKISQQHMKKWNKVVSQIKNFLPLKLFKIVSAHSFFFWTTSIEIFLNPEKFSETFMIHKNMKRTLAKTIIFHVEFSSIKRKTFYGLPENISLNSLFSESYYTGKNSIYVDIFCIALVATV